jgi:hypothetical protein
MLDIRSFDIDRHKREILIERLPNFRKIAAFSVTSGRPARFSPASLDRANEDPIETGSRFD